MLGNFFYCIFFKADWQFKCRILVFSVDTFRKQPHQKLQKQYIKILSFSVDETVSSFQMLIRNGINVFLKVVFLNVFHQFLGYFCLSFFICTLHVPSLIEGFVHFVRDKIYLFCFQTLLTESKCATLFKKLEKHSTNNFCIYS